MRPITASSAAAQSLAGRGPIGWRNDLRAGLTGWLPGFVTLLLGWQTALFVALLGGVIQLGAYAGIHILGCLVLAAWPALRLYRSVDDERTSAAVQIVVWSAFAGPFGAFVAAALAFPKALAPKKISPDADADDLPGHAEIGRVERAHIALLDRRVRLEGASRVRPLIDVIAEGTRSEKFEALRLVYRRYEAGLSTVLNRALRDPDDASVRVLAATVIAKLHATYSRNIGDRQNEAAANPELAQNWQTLAEARLAYAQCGLLDSPRAREQIELAIGDLSRAAELDPAGGASLVLEKARRQLAA